MNQGQDFLSSTSVVYFRNMEELRRREMIEDYSLTQTTLDEVFVRFASEQTGLLVDESKPKTFKQKVLDKLKPRRSNTETEAV